MEKGLIFIADEMNLSNCSTMKSIVPSLEIYDGNSIYIPGINKSIFIKKDFFFIACVNEQGTIGRNEIPNKLLNKLKMIEYPEQNENDILPIILELKNNIYKNYDENNEDEIKLGQFFVSFNQDIDKKLMNQLSLRDIIKILKRVEYQKSNGDKFINIKLYHNIYFYICSSINSFNFPLVSQFIINILKKLFPEESSDIENLEILYTQEVSLLKKNMIFKGKCGITLPNNIEYISSNSSDHIDLKKFENIKNLPTLYNAIFQMSLVHPEEPILISGPSGFKTHLAKIFMGDNTFSLVSLNEEYNEKQLIGGTKFLDRNNAKFFYLKYILLIGQSLKKINL